MAQKPTSSGEKGRNGGKKGYLKTFIINAGIFLVVLIGGALVPIYTEYTIPQLLPVELVVIAIIPTFLYLLISGTLKLKEISYKDFKAIFGVDKEADVQNPPVDPKKKSAGEETVLIELTDLPDESVEYIVLEDEEGRFQGLSHVPEVPSYFGNISTFLEMEDEPPLTITPEITDSIQSGMTNRQVLEKFQQLGVDVLPVVDSQRRYQGIVTKDSVLSDMLLFATQEDSLRR